MTDTSRRRRARTAALLLGILALLAVLAMFEHEASRSRSMSECWTAQAEELARFARGALASGNEILLVERLVGTLKRNDVAYAVLISRKGEVMFSGNPAEVGRRLAGRYTERALAARGTLVQDIPGAGAKEVAVPAGEVVLRIGFDMRHLAAADRWRWMSVALAVLGLLAGGLLLVRLS